MKNLLKAAARARKNSHSPYSGYQVGAAIRTARGKIYGGCNVENSSYGGTVCAERTAILKAVSEEGKIGLKEILVITDATPAWPPCGMCLQVISEFASPDLEIHLCNLKGKGETLKLKDLLPRAFTPRHLRKRGASE